MGPSGKVFTDHNVDDIYMPVREDKTLQVPRFLEHSIAAASTKEFVKDNLSFKKGLLRLHPLGWILPRKDEKASNTYFWTTVLIWILGGIGVAIGTICFFFGS